MHDNQAYLTPDCYYHVYNRAVGTDKLFHSAENYRYFLQKYRHFISPIADTFAYCLMPNHFHFLIQIKPLEVLAQPPTGFETLSGVELSNKLSQRFSHLQNGYAQAINKQQNRRGGLFMRPFKKKKIETEEYLKQTIFYIHNNPVKANLAPNLMVWQYSSFSQIVRNQNEFIKSKEVIEWFDDVDNFNFCH